MDRNNRFLELLKPNYNDAAKYCRALCANWSADDAEDVLQQSLLQAMEALVLSETSGWHTQLLKQPANTIPNKD